MPVSSRFSSNRGFTLIEIVMVLVLLGILTAVAVPKYFDLQDEARQKAALTAIAEAQSRINATFSQKLLQGSTCAEAVTYINNNFPSLGDSSDQSGDVDVALFGDFALERQGTLSAAGRATPVKVTMNGEPVGKEALGALVVAACSGVVEGTPPSSLSNFLELGNTQGKIIASYKQANSSDHEKAAEGTRLMQDLLANLGDPFIDNPVKYWRVVNSESLKQSNIFLTSTKLEDMEVPAMRVPFMQMQQTDNGEIRYFVGMMGVSKLSNGHGAMLINDHSGTHAGTVWNPSNGNTISDTYGGSFNNGTYLVKDSNGDWSQSLQPQAMGFEEAKQAYEELLKRYPKGYQLPSDSLAV